MLNLPEEVFVHFRLLTFLSCTLTLTSCIVTYRDYPAADQPLIPPVTAKSIIHYEIITRPQEVGWVYHSMTYSTLEELLERGGPFPPAIAVSDPPEEGIYVAVDVAIGFTGASPGIVFPRVETQPHMVSYRLSVDGHQKKIYVYWFNREVTWWFLAAPFILWGNLFTHDLDDALGATYERFLMDAQRDGYLQQ